MNKRTKEELVDVIFETFGLQVRVAESDPSWVNLYTPTGIAIVQLSILDIGTDLSPYWKIGGIGPLTEEFGWSKLMAL